MPETEADRGQLLLKAATSVSTDEGVFEAVISTVTVDRAKDIVEPDAMVKALHKWADVGKLVPLDWNHGEGAADQIGHVKPETAKNVGGEVVVEGWIDQSTENGEHAWRLVKSGTLGFSFYGLIPEGGAKTRKGGGLHITELDVAAVTATPTPMNNDTRVLAWKSTRVLETELQQVKDELGRALERIKGLEEKAQEADKEREQARSADALKERSRQAVAEVRLDGVPERKSPRRNPEPPVEPPAEADLRAQFRDVTLQLLRGT